MGLDLNDPLVQSELERLAQDKKEEEKAKVQEKIADIEAVVTGKSRKVPEKNLTKKSEQSRSMAVNIFLLIFFVLFVLVPIYNMFSGSESSGMFKFT